MKFPTNFAALSFIQTSQFGSERHLCDKRWEKFRVMSVSRYVTSILQDIAIFAHFDA